MPPSIGNLQILDTDREALCKGLRKSTSRVRLERGVIRALHHIHIGPTDATDLGLKNGDRITVTAKDHPRRLSLRDVLVCVSPDYRLELHLDPDEADAVGLRSGDHVVAPRRAAPGHSS